MTAAPTATTTATPADLVTALAALPDRRDFAFSAALGRAAWIEGDRLEWMDDTAPGRLHRLDPGVPLPAGTNLELVGAHRIGVCRPTDAGVDVLAIDLRSGNGSGSVRQMAAFATPRTCLLPRLPGENHQLLAVTGFDGTSVLLRIDWAGGGVAEAGRLPAPVHGGVWLDRGRRLALNLAGAGGRTSVYAVDLEAGRYSLLFEASTRSDDRAVLYDEDTGLLVVTTDAFGYPAVGTARLADPAGVRFLTALEEGEEAGHPWGFVGPRRALLLRHEHGAFSRLRTADPDTLEISPPLPVPDGEIGTPVVVDGDTVRFPFSAPDLPWRPARLTLCPGGPDRGPGRRRGGGPIGEPTRFTLDLEPEADGAPALHPARAVSFPGPAGPMPALVYEGGSDLVVVALHGGPIDRWGSDCRGELQLLAGLGCTVVALDYPGSTGSGQDHMRCLWGQAGAVDVEAVASVVGAVSGPGAGAGAVPPGRRVVLYGESYGAFLALAVAATVPVAGVIAFSPFASFSSLRASGSPKVREVLELLDGGNPDVSGRNLLEGRRSNRDKVLIVHGTADLTIPVREARALARALRDRRKAGDHDVRLVELDGQGHDLTGFPVLEHWYRELAAFVTSLGPVEIACPTKHEQQGR